MIRNLMLFVITAAALVFSMTASGEKAEFGSRDEARAMLVRAVAAVKADKAKALAIFNKGEEGFKDHDLYPFCFNLSDGTITANSAKPALVGTNVKALKDRGRAFGYDLYDAAKNGKEGDVAEVSYHFPRPGSNEPLPMVSFVARVADQGCGVGYYKK
jgi:hypothetical protein